MNGTGSYGSSYNPCDGSVTRSIKCLIPGLLNFSLGVVHLPLPHPCLDPIHVLIHLL